MKHYDFAIMRAAGHIVSTLNDGDSRTVVRKDGVMDITVERKLYH